MIVFYGFNHIIYKAMAISEVFCVYFVSLFIVLVRYFELFVYW